MKKNLNELQKFIVMNLQHSLKIFIREQPWFKKNTNLIF